MRLDCSLFSSRGTATPGIIIITSIIIITIIIIILILIIIIGSNGIADSDPARAWWRETSLSISRAYQQGFAPYELFSLAPTHPRCSCLRTHPSAGFASVCIPPGEDVVLRAQPKYGNVLETRDKDGESMQRVMLPQGVDNSRIDLPTALRLLRDYPKHLGHDPQSGEPVIVHMGYFPSIRVGNFSYNVDFEEAMSLSTLKEALERVESKGGSFSYDLGSYKNLSMWFIPKGKRAFAGAHVRWNKGKYYFGSKSEVSTEGMIPTREMAIELIRSKGKVSSVFSFFLFFSWRRNNPAEASLVNRICRQTCSILHLLE
jgi:hypothetical protein